MTKQLFALTFILMLLVALPASAYDFMVDGLCYNRNSDGTSVTVTYERGVYAPSSYTSLSGAITIPETVTYCGTTYSVTSIGVQAFYDCTGLTSVTIPNSVTTIGSSAFKGTGIYNNHPNGVFYVDKWVCGYKGDKSLGNLVLQSDSRGIADEAFSGCSGLTSVTIPNSVTTIGHWAFQGCSGLTSVTIPNSVTTIGGSAFKGCSGLTSVTWNAKNCSDFSSSSNSPFYNLTNIQSFTFGDEVEHIPAYVCYGLSGLTSVTIPNSVTTIGGGAFSGCSSLTSVTIPNSVTTIGGSAFKGCSGLTSVTWNAKNCSDFSSSSNSPFYNLTNIQSFTYGDEVEHIPAYVCYGLSGLTSVTIPNSVTSIGYNAFEGCSGLTNVTIRTPSPPSVAVRSQVAAA